MVSCRKCGKQSNNAYTNICKTCSLVEISSKTYSGNFLTVLIGVILLITSSMMFIATNPPAWGDFVPLFHNGSAITIVIVLIVIPFAIWNIRKEKRELKSRLTMGNYSGMDINDISKYTMDIGFGYMMETFGLVSGLLGLGFTLLLSLALGFNMIVLLLFVMIGTSPGLFILMIGKWLQRGRWNKIRQLREERESLLPSQEPMMGGLQVT